MLYFLRVLCGKAYLLELLPDPSRPDRLRFRPLHVKRIERIAARHHAVARRGRAVAERAADFLALQLPPGDDVGRKVGI